MKKLMILLVFNSLLFAANMQVLAPSQIVNPSKAFERAILLPPIPDEPAQFSIRVPVDVEAAKAGLKATYYTQNDISTDKQYLACAIYEGATQSALEAVYKQSKELAPGSQTVTFNFNGIPYQHLSKIDTYACYVVYLLTSGKELSPIFFQDGNTFETIVQAATGTIE